MLKHRGQSSKFDVTKQCSQLQQALHKAVERSQSNYALESNKLDIEKIERTKNKKILSRSSHVLSSSRGYDNLAFIKSTHTINEDKLCFDSIQR